MDEKINGTVHLVLGRSYPETGGKNKSALRWDLICDLRRGGRILSDREVIQQDGQFEGFARYDVGELDAFDLDELIRRDARSARELWKVCPGTGSQVEQTARMLEHLSAGGDLPDWWAAGEPRRRGS